MDEEMDADADRLSGSSVDDGFVAPTESLKRRWEAEGFHVENEERETARLKLEGSSSSSSGSNDVQVRQQWNDLVYSSAKAIHQNVLAFPWEKGIAGHVLSGKPLLQHLQPAVKFSTPTAFLSLPDATDPAKSERATIISRLEAIPGAWKFAAQRLSSLVTRVDKVATSRSTAIMTWKDIIVFCPEASVLGRTLLADLLAFSSDLHLISVIEDVCSGKSTSTLSKRGGHLMLYIAFCKRTNKDPFPVIERFFYYFLKDSRCAKAPSTAQSCRESMHLAATLIGLDGALAAADSPRVVGLCHRLLMGKRPRKQAKVLLVIQVLIMERVLMMPDADLPDRIFCGHCLFVVFARLRWSDPEHIEKMFEDLNEDGAGYIQADALGSKTSVTVQQKTSWLPFVATANGLEVPLWHQTWLRLREQAGLVQLPRSDEQMKPRVPFMPSVTTGGGFGCSPMTSNEASKFLRAILRQQGQSEDQVAGISSHSLKAVVLSWLRKYGVDPFHSKVAGYHSIAGEASMFSYARDNVAATLRVIDEVIDSVRTGVFQPDSTRSGYFDLAKNPGEHAATNISCTLPSDSFPPKPPTTLPADLQEVPLDASVQNGIWEEEVEGLFPLFVDDAVCPVVQFQGAVAEEEEAFVVSASESSSSSSESSDSDSDALGAVSFVKGVARAGASHSSDAFAVHNFHKTLHKCHDMVDERLACGRKLNAGYTKFDEEPVSMFHRCSTCFGTSSKQLTSA
jgi:hypothetical protein